MATERTVQWIPDHCDRGAGIPPDWSDGRVHAGECGGSAMLSLEQREHLGRRLQEERQRLLGQLHAFEEVDADETSQDQAGDLSKFPTHPADLGTDANAEEVELAIGTRMSQELAEIDAALDRLATSPETFGQDDETGEPIPFERLDIIPYARVGAERKTEAEAEAESR
jgi:RNA polymerase-binding transcription factor DksA